MLELQGSMCRTKVLNEVLHRLVIQVHEHGSPDVPRKERIMSNGKTPKKLDFGWVFPAWSITQPESLLSQITPQMLPDFRRPVARLLGLTILGSSQTDGSSRHICLV